MADSIISRQVIHGIAIEATSVGTETEPTIGLPNLNKAFIQPGQAWVEDAKQTGLTVPTTTELISDAMDPTFSPETTMFFPEFGALMQSLCQESTESGSGPYVQEIQPDTTDGKMVTFGETITTENPTTFTIKEIFGGAGGTDVFMNGAIVSRIDVTIPETGLVRVTPTFMGLGYDDGDTAAGSTTLPASTLEKMGRDFVFELGDSPAALHSKEISMSFIANIVPKRYGGLNGVFPIRYIYNGWSLEGSITKPVVSGTDTMAKDFLIGGGDTGEDQLLFIYSTTMTGEDEAAASMANGEMRFTLNVKFNDAVMGGDDELIETISFTGVQDGTNNIFMFEQCTTAAQAWAS